MSDKKFTAQESSFVLAGQFCSLIVLVAFASIYVMKCHRIIHKDKQKNQMHAKTSKIHIKYIVQLFGPISWVC